MSRHASIDTDVTSVEETVSKWSRFVTAKRTAIGTVIGVVLNLLVDFHVITPGLSTHATTGVAGAFTVLTVIGAGAWIHHGVTPADPDKSPTDSNGNLLMPITEVAAKVAAVIQSQTVPVDDPDLIPVDAPDVVGPADRAVVGAVAPAVQAAPVAPAAPVAATPAV